MKTIYSNELLTEIHKLSVWWVNKEVARYLKLTEGQVRYALYKLEPNPLIPERQKTLFVPEQAEQKVTHTEILLNFFGGGD